jgi:hypothetical protein
MMTKSIKFAVIQTWIASIQTITQHQPAQHQTSRKATILLMKEEISDYIKEIIRHVAGSADLGTYMKTKYK